MQQLLLRIQRLKVHSCTTKARAARHQRSFEVDVAGDVDPGAAQLSGRWRSQRLSWCSVATAVSY